MGGIESIIAVLKTFIVIKNTVNESNDNASEIDIIEVVVIYFLYLPRRFLLFAFLILFLIFCIILVDSTTINLFFLLETYLFFAYLCKV